MISVNRWVSALSGQRPGVVLGQPAQHLRLALGSVDRLPLERADGCAASRALTAASPGAVESVDPVAQLFELVGHGGDRMIK